MALDLTPQCRRLKCQSRNLRESVASVQHGFSGPFCATQLWHNIIHALKTQVEVRSCRRHLRVHAECFIGSDAVDAVLSYLMQNVMFSTSEVSRLKAARLCQALMEAKVFEPVGTKLFCTEKEVSFEDGTSSLYRFIEPTKDTENVWPNELETKWNKDSSQSEMRTFSNPVVIGPSERRIDSLLKTINLQLPISPSLSQRSASTPLLSKAVVEEVWKQQALLQLLQILEVPVLESILTSSSRVQPKTILAPLTTPDLVFSNTCLERELTDTLNLHQLDDWLSAAADLLEVFPDQLIVVTGERLCQNCNADDIEEQKRLIFDTICNYYSGQEKSPLFSGRYRDIYIAILQLINAEKNEAAIKATQLCLRLLDSSVRDELRRLLTFMAVAAHPEACCLQEQTDNGSLIRRTFQKAIVQHNDLSQSQIEALIFFFISNQTEIFKTPKILINAVRETLRKMQQGEDPDFASLFTFCEQITSEEFEDQREAATLENLKMLLHDILMNKNMPVKQKKRLLKEFEKHHPVVFLQHFPLTSEIHL